MRQRSKWLLVLVLSLFLIAVTACGQAGNSSASQNGQSGNSSQSANQSGANSQSASNLNTSKPFVIGVLPDQNISQVHRRLQLLATYLHQQTGLNVKTTNVANYAALVTAFKRGDVQLAWFGGLTGVEARATVPGSQAIAMRPTDGSFHSVIVVHQGVKATSLKDLKGLTFTFGDPNSTSGHLMPSYYLRQAGVNPQKDFNGPPNFSGSHDKTWKLVESGAYQAGALNAVVWNERVKQGKVDKSKVHKIYTTPAFYDYNWSIRGDVDKVYGQGAMNKVKKALLNISASSSNEQSEILKVFTAKKFVPTSNSNYTKIKSVAEKLGIIKSN